jgi:hypothetical protein
MYGSCDGKCKIFALKKKRGYDVINQQVSTGNAKRHDVKVCNKFAKVFIVIGPIRERIEYIHPHPEQYVPPGTVPEKQTFMIIHATDYVLTMLKIHIIWFTFKCCRHNRV